MSLRYDLPTTDFIYDLYFKLFLPQCILYSYESVAIHVSDMTIMVTFFRSVSKLLLRFGVLVNNLQLKVDY
jgi:hypothetical protein